MNHNPRKFEEKIALNKQKQAEQDKQFEDIIRDVNTIRDEVPNTSQSFRSLPNINGPPPGIYQPYNLSFGGIQGNQPNVWHEDLHHHLNLPNEYGQNRRVLSDSQLHKPSMRMDNNNNDETGPYSISRPKSADMVSYENSFLSKTGSLPDLSGNFLPVQDESFSQNILHYQEPHDQQRMQVSPPAYHLHQQQGFFMSLDEATGSDLQRSHQFSPVPSPPATSQFSYSYSNIGSPNQSYAHLTNQMQDFHLHSGAGSPGPPSGAASPEMRNDNYDIKPYLQQEDMKPYIYYSSPHDHQPDINYQNPPSIPKIQVYTPDEALSPQYYPPDDQMGQQDMNNMFDFNDAMLEDQLLEDDNVQGSLDGMYSYVYPHSWTYIGPQRVGVVHVLIYTHYFIPHKPVKA